MSFNPQYQTRRITDFLQNIFRSENIKKVVIGLSGGVDSAVAFSLLCQSIGPEKVYALNLPYLENTIHPNINELIKQFELPESNIEFIPLNDLVNKISTILSIPRTEDIRIGNIAARLRMTILYDRAKKNKAIVCGTENLSEHMLGYFTRGGDEISDVEPLRHLLKSEVYQLADYLHIPSRIIKSKPTAGFYEGQTDEQELGFSYDDADKIVTDVINNTQRRKTEMADIVSAKVLARIAGVSYKLKVPYTLNRE